MKINQALLYSLIIALTASTCAAQTEDAKPVKLRNGALIQISLPITGNTSAQVEEILLRYVGKTPAAIPDHEKPVLVLEFDTSNGRNGRGSKFEACLSLARCLVSAKMTRVQTIAYIPGPKGVMVDAEVDSQLKSQLLGHATLVAMACNHIVMHTDASIGQAGIDEESVDDLVVESYRRIAEQRFRFPSEFAIAMVDPKRSLHRIQIDDKYIFGDDDELNRLQAEGKVDNSETITAVGSLPLFDSNQLTEYQLLQHRVTSRRDISRRFGLKQNALQGAPTMGKEWVAVQINLDRVIDQRTVSWVINALNQRWKSDSENNLLLINIDASEVDVSEAIRLARHLATYDSSDVQTIAFVPRESMHGAGLIALACDHVVMTPKSSLGGKNEKLDKQQVAELMGAVRELAEEKNRDWSLMAAMLDPGLKVYKFRNKSSQIRILSKAEHESLEDKEQWFKGTELALEDGMDSQTAAECFVATYVVDDFEQLKSFYQITDKDVEVLAPTLADRWIENLATFLASPMVAFWLLFGAMFFLSSEMSQPGIGIPGFVGVILILLFFWSQFLDGNAEVFEIMLFIVGLICIAVELFVLPGFGVFGFGGLLLIVTSIVLATQKFGLLPSNSEELRQLPISMLMVIGASCGCIAAMFVFRKFLPNMPVLKRLMLSPPGEADDEITKLEDREAVVNLSHLVGQTGMSLTALMPTGKAQFGGEIVDVITDGRMIDNKTQVIVMDVKGNVVRVTTANDAGA